MSLQENNNINNFLSGTINKSKRKQFIDQFKTKNNTREKEMKRNNNKDFNSENAWNKLYDRIENDGLISSQNNNRFVLRNFSRIAAAIILLLGLSISGYLIFNTDNYIEISNFSEIQEIKLPDGSIVTLNSNSSIKYPKKFNDKTREIDFFGEAFFEVSKNPDRPFIIKTNEANITVLGTSFNLSAKKNNTELTVTTGKVQLSKSKNLSENVILEVGDKGSIINNKISKESNSNINYLSWKTKNLYYYKVETLSKVFSDLNDVFHINIIYNDEEIGNYKLNPTKFINYEPDTILEIIFRAHPLKKEEIGDKIIISKREE